jgi:hypothetical protein
MVGASTLKMVSKSMVLHSSHKPSVDSSVAYLVVNGESEAGIGRRWDSVPAGVKSVELSSRCGGRDLESQRAIREGSLLVLVPVEVIEGKDVIGSA